MSSQEIETIDAEEEPEEEEYVDETEEFISNYVPINEIPEEEPEEEREIDEDIDYEDGFVASYDDGFTDNGYSEERVPEEEFYDEVPFQRDLIQCTFSTGNHDFT